MSGYDTGRERDGPTTSAHMRPFIQRSQYKILSNTLGSISERTNVGSQSSIASMSGSMHNLLDPVRLMSMQEDARLRKISTEVVKRSLYKSVTAPCRRRMMNRMSYCGTSSRRNNDDSLSVSVNQGGNNSSYSRMFQSLPVTPLQSHAASPSHSPTGNKQFFYEFLSRGATPRCTTPEPEEIEEAAEENGSDCRGLATLFRPQPRYVSARDHTFVVDGGAGDFIDQNEESFNLVSVGNLAPLRKSLFHRTSVDARQRNNIIIKTSSPVFANTPV